MSEGSKLITLECMDCGEVVQRPAYCPFTGHYFDNGWTYKCSCCGGNMKVVMDVLDGYECECSKVLRMIKEEHAKQLF
jgi:hypothetical protein